jgi:anti-anti-sigma factor
MLLLKYVESPGCESLTVDLNEVPYLDTSCLAVLLEILRAARAGTKEFYLSGLQDRPRYLLEATRILSLFEVTREVSQ